MFVDPEGKAEDMVFREDQISSIVGHKIKPPHTEDQQELSDKDSCVRAVLLQYSNEENNPLQLVYMHSLNNVKNYSGERGWIIDKCSNSHLQVTLTANIFTGCDKPARLNLKRVLQMARTCQGQFSTLPLSSRNSRKKGGQNGQIR